MQACVIFNPTACGERAQRFRQFLSQIGPRAVLRPTLAAGAARSMARDAVLEGHEFIIAAGGDGTAHEVLNGIADAPAGLARTVLGILPLGTANVLAHELRIPADPARAWEALRNGQVHRIDTGVAEFAGPRGQSQSARFAIVAGAGLDARAVQLVEWNLKKRCGKLAYVASALRAFVQFRDKVHCSVRGLPCCGRAVLAGNGRFYAGEIPIFDDGALFSGRLHVRVIPSVTPSVLWRCLMAYATHRWSLQGRFPAEAVTELRLTSDRPVPLQLDGEFAGWLPATLRIEPASVRVLTPATLTQPEGRPAPCAARARAASSVQGSVDCASSG
jgi:diacylglycerol kinase family enzyme